jgi:hypothetical protein
MGQAELWRRQHCRVFDWSLNVQEIGHSAAAFAAISADGGLVSWGALNFASDSSGVQEQLSYM